jgi:hypothetical protein
MFGWLVEEVEVVPLVQQQLMKAVAVEEHPEEHCGIGLVLLLQESLLL